MFVPTGFLLGTSAVKTLKSKNIFVAVFSGILMVLFCFFQKKNVEKEKLTNLSEKAVKIEMFFFSHCMRCGRQVEDKRTSAPSIMRDKWETSGGQVEDKNKIMRPRHATL